MFITIITIFLNFSSEDVGGRGQGLKLIKTLGYKKERLQPAVIVINKRQCEKFKLTERAYEVKIKALNFRISKISKHYEPGRGY